MLHSQLAIYDYHMMLETHENISVLLTFLCREIGITPFHYSDVIMGTMASQITTLSSVNSTVYSGADQRKH